MPIGLDIGIGPSSLFIPVTSSPDGVLTMPKGTLAVDTSTGVTWVNENGGSLWWPEIVPPRQGNCTMYDFNGGLDSPWLTLTSGGGSSNSNVAPGAGGPGALGIIRLTTAAVADRVSMRASGSTSWLLFGLGVTYAVWRVGPETSAEDGTNNYTMRVGFGDVDGGDFIDGAYFEADRTTYGDNNWRICTASNSVRTKVATSVAPASVTYQRLRIRVNAAATAVDFWINDAYQGQITTNIPSGNGRETAAIAQTIKTLGAASRSVDIDYAAFAAIFSAAR